MGRKLKTGLLAALALIMFITAAGSAYADQLYLNELLEAAPHLQVLKEGPVMRVVKPKDPEPIVEPEPAPAPAPTPRGKVALTFDDGPDLVNTPKILDILRDEEVTATFFVIGEKAERYPEMLARIHREGHLIANHSQTHADFAELTNEEILAMELEPTSQTLQKVAGYYSMIMRPPYGSLRQDSVTYLREQGWQIVRWSLDTFDWDNSRNSPEEIIERIKTQHHNKAIVLMHCNGPTTIQALPDVISILRSLGYELVAVDQL
jgi:peptidoglycan/xylan/chitin deacetylase (PgdA/CDA1 family)